MDFSKMLIKYAEVDKNIKTGDFEYWRYTVGHGGINSKPLPQRVVAGIKNLKPRYLRTFIQEYFNIYKGDGDYDFSLLDPYIFSLAATGAKIVASICIKPSILFPEINQEIYMPNDKAAWQRLIFALVKRYSVDNEIVSHWEIGNESDIGENGGCPYLIKTPEEYFEYYKLTAESILSAFPKARVGGPGAAWMSFDFMKKFSNLCFKENIQLDFVSWHTYTDNYEAFGEQIRKNREAMEVYGDKKPEILLTEINSNFENPVVEESAFRGERAVKFARLLFTAIDNKLDYTFYYHIWDQTFYEKEFSLFYSNPYIMQQHWNEIPHRFGMFGVNTEVRPQYFLHKMLGMAGESFYSVIYEQPFLIKAIGNEKTTSLLVINPEEDMILRICIKNMPEGEAVLENYRIDDAKHYDSEILELIPTEKRIIYLKKDFYCHIYCPENSVSLFRINLC
ncbi:MAG: hypothetical protein K0S55_1559 [Clostridia bacterium]|nr:hypothetical protein [Clostridia bacterium]